MVDNFTREDQVEITFEDSLPNFHLLVFQVCSVGGGDVSSSGGCSISGGTSGSGFTCGGCACGHGTRGSSASGSSASSSSACGSSASGSIGGEACGEASRYTQERKKDQYSY